MLTAIEKQYINILADFLNQRETIPDKELGVKEWKEISRISGIQKTQGILWKQCGSYLKKHHRGIAEKVHKGFQNDVFKSVYYEEDLKEVDQLLTDAGVPYTLMKGSVLYSLYPEPRLRTMSDIDVIIRSEDRFSSNEAMKKAGYDVIIPTRAEYVYERDIIEYEFHDKMISEPLANHIDYEAYFDQVWKYVRQPENGESMYHPMDENFHFIFLFVHIAKHVLNAGMGMRSYMDLPVIAREIGEKMDWEWISAELEKLGLLTFAGVCEAFCEKWFGIGFPIKPVVISDEFFESTTRKILGEGIYGHEDQENVTGYAAKAVKRSNKPYWYVAAGIILGRIFPSYQNMRLISWYSFVDHRPWLMPVAWVYRWIYVLIHKRETGRESFMETIEKKSIIEKRQGYYSNWGL